MATTSKKIHPSHASESTIRQDEFKHLVQFYESDAFLIEAISNFISVGLRNGDACIVIATKPHRESLEEQLNQKIAQCHKEEEVTKKKMAQMKQEHDQKDKINSEKIRKLTSSVAILEREKQERIRSMVAKEAKETNETKDQQESRDRALAHSLLMEEERLRKERFARGYDKRD